MSGNNDIRDNYQSCLLLSLSSYCRFNWSQAPSYVADTGDKVLPGEVQDLPPAEVQHRFLVMTDLMQSYF